MSEWSIEHAWKACKDRPKPGQRSPVAEFEAAAVARRFRCVALLRHAAGWNPWRTPCQPRAAMLYLATVVRRGSLHPGRGKWQV
jgi:hypothetical protein